MRSDDSDRKKTLPPSALPDELHDDNDNTDVMCTRCGSRMTCTVCEACNLHCLERDAERCALHVVEATSYLRGEQSLRSVRQLAWALQVKMGITAAAAAHKLVRD